MTTHQQAVNTEILSRLNDIYDMLRRAEDRDLTPCNERSMDWLPGTQEDGFCIRPLGHPGPCHFAIVTASPNH